MVSQQTPSTQFPEWHSLPPPQEVARSLVKVATTEWLEVTLEIV